MFKFLFLIVLILTLILRNKEQYNEDNVCRGKLTDKEYLQHMIPHHQVAVDISIMLQKVTKSPVML